MVAISILLHWIYIMSFFRNTPKKFHADWPHRRIVIETLEAREIMSPFTDRETGSERLKNLLMVTHPSAME